MVKKYPRDMVGYGSKKVKVILPNNAKLALQIVLNYEEGAENSVLHGDKFSETFLSEIIGAQPIKGRHINMESLYDYGSRSGFWRLHKIFQEKKIPITIFAVGMALERNPEICKTIKESEITKKNELDNFLKKITPFIEKYIAENSVGLVLNQKNIFIADKKYDITEKIIAIVDENLK